MIEASKKVKVNELRITGDDVENLKNLCEVMEGVAQTVLNADLREDFRIRVMNTFSFCRKIIQEFS